jgi:thioredoxin reductase
VFDSVVAITFQIAFRAEIHVNDVFLFFKNHFSHQQIKTIQKVQTALNFSKNLKIKNLMKHSYKHNVKPSLKRVEAMTESNHKTRECHIERPRW